MIFLGLGSNLPSSYGNRFKNLKLALSNFKTHGIKIVKKSSFYETPSYPDETKPKFINMVVLVKTRLNLSDLITSLVSIENQLERKRKRKNAPRTCDIDILDYNKKILRFKRKNKFFYIPHKKIESRSFVLFPLQEIFPKWKHPKTNEKIDFLINKLKLNHKRAILKISKN